MNDVKSSHQGEHAQTPFHLSWQSWRSISKRVALGIDRDNLGLIAAGIAFYIMLSAFPLLIALVATFGLIADREFVRTQIADYTVLMPEEAQTVLLSQLNSLVSQPATALSTGLIISTLAAIWSASKGARAIIIGMNIAYNEREKRNIVRLYFTSLVFTIGVIAFAIIGPLTISLLPLIFGLIFPESTIDRVLSWLRWPILFVLAIVGLAILNRFGPSRNHARWHWVTVGSVATAVLWLLGSLAFSKYLTFASSLHETYGGLTGVVILMLWIYIASFLLLFGAEINAEIEQQTLIDSTVGPEKPMGERGAMMADTTPEDNIRRRRLPN